MKVFISEQALQRHARGRNIHKLSPYRTELAPLQGTWAKVKYFQNDEFILKSGMGIPLYLIDNVELEDPKTWEEFKKKHEGNLTESELWKIENLLLRVGVIKAEEKILLLN
jgi:hypothetical protein